MPKLEMRYGVVYRVVHPVIGFTESVIALFVLESHAQSFVNTFVMMPSNETIFIEVI